MLRLKIRHLLLLFHVLLINLHFVDKLVLWYTGDLEKFEKAWSKSEVKGMYC